MIGGTSQLAVLIPAHNEAHNLPATLRSILAAGISPVDVLVIDDGSTDGTALVALAFNVRVISSSRNYGKAQALKFAAPCVRGYDLVALLDADTTVDPGYFRTVKRAFIDPTVAVVCGKADSVPYNWLTAYRALSYAVTNWVHKDAQSLMGVITVAPGCATTYRGSVFARLDWRTEPATLVEDMDLTVQVHLRGLGRIVYEPGAVVRTQDPRTLRDFLRQSLRWQTGFWQVARKHGLLGFGTGSIGREFKLLAAEGLFIALLAMLTPVWAFLVPVAAARILLGSLLATIAVALFAGALIRRRDIMSYAPLFVFLQFLDCVIFVTAWFRVSVLGHVGQHRWSSPARY